MDAKKHKTFGDLATDYCRPLTSCFVKAHTVADVFDRYDVKNSIKLAERERRTKVTALLTFPIWSQCSAPLLGRDEVTRTNRGAEGIGGRVKFLPLAWAGMPKRPFILSPPSLSLRLRQNNRPYGYRGLKIFTSLKLRFQDFQRMNWINSMRFTLITLLQKKGNLRCLRVL
jgi:hypothetical protein